MKIEDYGLRFIVDHSLQSPQKRGRAVHHHMDKIINQTSFDFVSIKTKFHGNVLFSLTYKKNNYFILDDYPLKVSCWIKFPRGPADYQPWLLAIVQELLVDLESKKVRNALDSILKEAAKTIKLPNVVLEKNH